ncbi:hypothetical protein J2Z66_002319 [Paenibacillus eucommiae]|uniref:Uncharacterized protein n=1 Tax=Paenibacillus eucommiae TaxID=1355755 RepID=A0ABS4IT25_9BACL|nr:hypothetical protein [Paenibacillus eucommiae]
MKNKSMHHFILHSFNFVSLTNHTLYHFHLLVKIFLIVLSVYIIIIICDPSPNNGKYFEMTDLIIDDKG